MWTVSPQFLAAITTSHRITSTCTVTVPGGVATPLRLVAGTVSCDRSNLIRRAGQNITVSGGSAVYDLLQTPGARVAISHGIVLSANSPELVPVITGELSSAAQTVGDGTVTFELADLWQKVAAEGFATVYSPSTSTTRVTEITNRITAAVPGVTVTNTSTDSGTVFSFQTWDSRSDLIAQLATDGGLEVFFTPDGNFTIRNEPQPTDSAVWATLPGDGGVVQAIQRQVPLDQLYNAVTVRPSAGDGSQTWSPQTKTITDTSHPRYSGKIGTRPYVYESSSIATASAALFTAGTLLSRFLGSTETFQLDVLSNPALEAGDVIEIQSYVDTGIATVQHMVESFSLDLATGNMTINTRSDAEAVS